MARDIDLIIESAGQNAPAKASSVNLTEYQIAQQVRGVSRTLLNLSPGTTDNIRATVEPTMAKIKAETGGNLGRLGAICLIGFSNGSGQTLAFAKALIAAGAPKLTYIGIGDLTLYPFGRQPPIDGIGRLIPENAPQIYLGVNMAPGFRGLAPNAAIGDVPFINNPGIAAETMENFYTVEGNRVRWFPNPPKSGALGGWWWTSSMNGSEVHGRIVGGGWDNLPLPTTSSGQPYLTGSGSIDEGHHDNLCGKAFTRTAAMAGQLPRGFVLKL